MRNWKRIFVLATLLGFSIALGIVFFYRQSAPQAPIIVESREFPFLGDEDAPVKLVIFEDFLCPGCARFGLHTFPLIRSTYIDTGKASCSFIPIALTDASKMVANGVLSVFHRAPDSCFAFMQEVFLHFTNHRFNESALFLLGKKVEGLDQEAFIQDIQTGRYNAALETNWEIAKRDMENNIRVPAILINGELAPGISFDVIAAEIESIAEDRGDE